MHGSLTRWIQTTDLTLTRDRTTIIDGLDWRAEQGRVAWVVGENGTGKSTLLGALAGRIGPASGDVSVHPSGAPRLVVYTPAMAPPPETRLRDWKHLTSGLVPDGPSPSLEPDLRPNQRLGQVSTGEQRRLLLEVLLKRFADIYLLDEPFEHLSPNAKQALLQRLKGLTRHAVVVVATNQGAVTRDDTGAADGALHLFGHGEWRWDPPR